MTTDTEQAPRKGRHVFTVHMPTGDGPYSFKIRGDDFEVAEEGVHIVQDRDSGLVGAFVSHPCMIVPDYADVTKPEGAA